MKPANILQTPDASGDPYAPVPPADHGIALRPESPERGSPPTSSARPAASPPPSRTPARRQAPSPTPGAV
ncbi:hypothetical protein [Streptomyces sp. NPDC050988]|uniref:hypothetical protein n=1 Tax=Streptomyces sp. NPDC050988 TaxID=3365637 RepID=UPI003792B2EB